MRTAKIMVLLLVIGGASLAARQVAKKIRATNSGSVAARPQVEVVSAIPRNETGRYALGDITLLNDGEAWAVGYDGEHTAQVYNSKDGGKTWQAVDVPGTGFTFKALTFSDMQHGWAVGGNGLIIRTNNRGKSWELLKPPTPPEAGARGCDLHAVHFADASIGYISGHERLGNKINDEVSGSFKIFCTKDGGESWRKCYQENLPLTALQILAVSQSGAFAVLGSHLIRTDNQGETWQRVSTSAKHISSIAFAPDGRGWSAGSEGVFQTSADGGKTWQRLSSLPQVFANRNWEAVAFNTNGIGLAVGENSTLALTTDNGKTWTLQTWTASDHLRGVRIQGWRAIVIGAQKVYSIDFSRANTQEAKR